MTKITKVQSRVDKVLATFKTAIKELDASISELATEKARNEEHIKALAEWNTAATSKMTEYQKIKANIEGIMK